MLVKKNLRVLLDDPVTPKKEAPLARRLWLGESDNT
jgi:hypothetical protein